MPAPVTDEDRHAAIVWLAVQQNGLAAAFAEHRAAVVAQNRELRDAVHTACTRLNMLINSKDGIGLPEGINDIRALLHTVLALTR